MQNHETIRNLQWLALHLAPQQAFGLGEDWESVNDVAMQVYVSTHHSKHIRDRAYQKYYLTAKD